MNNSDIIIAVTFAQIFIFTVKSGDNLGNIAQQFGMTLSEIMSLNNIRNPDKIQIGQKLKVYDETDNFYLVAHWSISLPSYPLFH
ncbi:LysM peptidoglycan-binding domain-containing protein [Virgibacillus sp. NKC19-3]|uniref:LysM peptidoglycan-binding domain-containing protein n=1 Tax=Virgibacillus saliphilus TaxID=2831674 RepID=UPI001C9AEA45|nr:LysM domain-containing protein [Virgibacillus sp. NKC19-3]MBY7142451.1 LysM peptidoglycan-binding domain-containing protein [Virgibacillus sp. NKC19-3]